MSALPQPTPHIAAQPGKQVTPMFFFDNINAYQKSAAMMAAIELDLFTKLGEAKSEEERTADALARKTGAHSKGIRVLCDFLTIHGLLTKSNGASPLASYEATPDVAFFLDARSPAALVHAPKFLAPPALHELAKDITESVRKGGTAFEQEETNEKDPRWVDFARGMAPFTGASAAPMAQLVKRDGPQNILDIAASHGLFGIACLQANPQAQVVAVDGAEVLQVGEENARKFGVADRWTKLPGDAFTADFGTGYDTVLVTNFLHHFEPELNEKFLRRVHASLNPGGRVFVLEFVPNDDRVSPPVPASFALIMLTRTQKGDAYTYRQLTAMLENAGFRGIERHDLPIPQTIIIGTK
jgi:ubiquinone/menaquinone biosynthesis C-methylase UbiE